MTSASRTEPPGCTTAVAPAAGDRVEPVAKREERVGRRRPTRAGDRRAFMTRRLDGIDAAHLPGADRQRRVAAP